jgi:hypothetical protein
LRTSSQSYEDVCLTGVYVFVRVRMHERLLELKHWLILGRNTLSVCKLPLAIECVGMLAYVPSWVRITVSAPHCSDSEEM